MNGSYRKGRRLLARRKRRSWLDRTLFDCLLPSFWTLFDREKGHPRHGR